MHISNLNALYLHAKNAIIAYYYIGTTLAEGVKKGAEFTNNYRRFIIPDFYTAYCKKNNITDVRTLVLSIVDAGK